jgi:hypothetical protein
MLDSHSSPRTVHRVLTQGNMMNTQQIEAAEYEAAYNPSERFADFDCGDKYFDYEAAQQAWNEDFARENGL